MSHGKATLIELDRDYSVPDAYDLLEMIDIENDIEYAQQMDQQTSERQQSRNRR